MAPKREIKKRMGKKHRQASTRPKLGKGPAKGARKGSAVTGAVSPKGRKKLSSKRAAEEKSRRTPTRSPEFERRVIVGNEESGGARSKTQIPFPPQRAKALDGDPGSRNDKRRSKDNDETRIPFPPQRANALDGDPGSRDANKRGKGKHKNEEQVQSLRRAQGQSDKVSKSESKRKARRSAADADDIGETDRELAALSSDLWHATRSADHGTGALPLVAICGRPNVGKSTLFNRLTGTRRSIVGDEPGITRDRIYGEVEWAGRTVRLVDTGGVVPDDEALIPSEIFRQARVALEEADAVVMVVDGRTELAAPDKELALLLLKGGKPVFLAVNKMDSAALEAGAENFRTLGFRNVFPVSAEHGSGIGDLLDEVWALLPASPLKATEQSEVAEEPAEVMDSIGDEIAEDAGDAFADRAALETRAMREALLAGEGATAHEPAGVDAPPVGVPDVEAPTQGSGVEPALGRDGSIGGLQESPDAAVRAPGELAERDPDGGPREGLDEVLDRGSDEVLDKSSDEGQAATPVRERKLRTHGEHVSRETKIAIIGRPNVGKSTLLNALTGTERAIVSPIAGTTRDAVDEVVTRDGHDFRFIDTAGIRRKGKTRLMAEKLSVIMSRKHLEAADVALLMIDATEGVTGSDATIGGYAHESGRSVIVVVNKWDLMTRTGPDGMRLLDGKPPAEKKVFEEQVRDHLKYLDYAPIVFVSAAEAKGIDQVFKKVELVARERRKRITTGNMNRFLDKVDFGRASVPMNKRVRIYYMTQAAVAPPTFVLFTDRDVKLHFSYERFLSNEIRDAFKFIGSPIWFKVKARNKKKKEE